MKVVVVVMMNDANLRDECYLFIPLYIFWLFFSNKDLIFKYTIPDL